MEPGQSNWRVAIACGGTGGHLFPGLAVADVLRNRGCDVRLLASEKEIDQEALKAVDAMEVTALPAIGLQNGDWFGFAQGMWESARICRRQFQASRPHAVLAMGGFTSAPPVLAGKWAGSLTFLHEANAIPGRANRWLAPFVDEAFTAYPGAASRLASQNVRVTGMPVRAQFEPLEAAACRLALRLDPNRPVLLVLGGSQGASALNDLVLDMARELVGAVPDLQYLHIAGLKDREKVAEGYRELKTRQHLRRQRGQEDGPPVQAIVYPFLSEMELALGAATLAISRAGASSLAEFAAMRVPSILIPYPAAVDNHQYYNARALAESRAALLVEQKEATPGATAGLIRRLIGGKDEREGMKRALERWHVPDAAEQIASRILAVLGGGDERAEQEITRGMAAAPIAILPRP